MKTISLADYTRFMERIHASGFRYPEGRMESPAHFMKDAVGMHLQRRGDPFTCVIIRSLDVSAGRVGVMQTLLGPVAWIDVDDLQYWEPVVSP